MDDVYIQDCIKNIKKCALEVYKELGHSYEDDLNDVCFRRELNRNHLPFVKIVPCPHIYKGEFLDTLAPYVHQYIISDLVTVEIDSMDRDGQKSDDYYQLCLSMTMKEKLIAISFSQSRESEMFIEKDLSNFRDLN